MRRPGGKGGAGDSAHSVPGTLDHLWQLARQDAQRPGNIGAGLKVLEALLNLPSFRPSAGGRA